MKLNAPTQALWLISVILGGLGILSHFVRIDTISRYSFELLAIGFVILVVGTLLRRA
jgi:energy-converting hydrogenase Eha subunit C